MDDMTQYLSDDAISAYNDETAVLCGREARALLAGYADRLPSMEVEERARMILGVFRAVSWKEQERRKQFDRDHPHACCWVGVDQRDVVANALYCELVGIAPDAEVPPYTVGGGMISSLIVACGILAATADLARAMDCEHIGDARDALDAIAALEKPGHE